ncbi:MAG: YhfC family glutamic-type intramembrane protease [Candidatus Bathyarchaeia archaeon]
MVEVSPLLLFSGVGMVSVGLLAWIWWAPRARFRFFLYGGLLWAAAIAVKLVMDLTVTQPFSQQLSTAVGQGLLASVTLGLYVGLRTGLLECGFPYVAALMTRLREAAWREVFAVGLGFGAFEAVLLGVQSLLNVATIMLNPSVLDSLPPGQREAVVRQLSYGAAVVPAPILERAFTLVAHLFATVLAVYAAKASKLSLLAASILYKTVLDGPIPIFGYVVPERGLLELYLIEAYLGALALVAALGLFWFRKRSVDSSEPGLP